MKIHYNSIGLKIIKHQRCEDCFFNGTKNNHLCGVLPLSICFRDSQIYYPTQEFFEIFRL